MVTKDEFLINTRIFTIHPFNKPKRSEFDQVAVTHFIFGQQYLVLPFVLTGLTYLFWRFVGGPEPADTHFHSIRAQLITYGVLMPLVAIVGAATY